jgi:hypothetical protein
VGDGAGVVGRERACDPETLGDNVNESVMCAEKEVCGAGAEAGEVALFKK